MLPCCNFGACSSPLDRLQLRKNLATESPDALFFHQRIVRRGEGLHDRMPPGIEFAYILAESQRVMSEQGHSAGEFCRTELVDLRFCKWLFVRRPELPKMFV